MKYALQYWLQNKSIQCEKSNKETKINAITCTDCSKDTKYGIKVNEWKMKQNKDGYVWSKQTKLNTSSYQKSKQSKT